MKKVFLALLLAAFAVAGYGADRVQIQRTQGGDTAVTFRDMGDGTWAQVTASRSVSFTSSVTITRPANTTQYTGGDVVGVDDGKGGAGSAILTFANMCQSGGSVLITSVDLAINVTSVPSGMTSFRLHLYDTSPTAILDNAAWDLVSGDRGYYLGYIDVGTPVDVGSTLYVQADGVNRQFKCAASSTSLYGELVTNGTYTPSSGAVKKITLHGLGL